MTLMSHFLPRARVLCAMVALLLLAACASVPPPTGLMSRAQQQIDTAQKAQATDYAPVDLGFAKKRFQAAQAAMVAKKYDVATDMANESLADGRLAQTRAELAVLRKQVRAQTAENARLHAQLLAKPAATGKPAAADQNGDNGGLPSQIVLPQPAAPASAASAPAPAASVSSGGVQ